MFTKLWLVVMIVASLTVFPSSATYAQGMDVEPNDSCATAQDLGAVTLPFNFNGDLNGFPFPGGDIDFFKLTGTSNTILRVDLEGGSTGMGTLGDPFLGLFDSNCNLVATNDDGGEGSNSRLTLTVPADGVVVLGVTRCCDGAFNDGGNGTYLLSLKELLPPSNDNFADATEISALPFDDSLDTSAASLEVDEFTSTCGFGIADKTVWYVFTPSTSGSITASFNFADFSPIIAAYTGDQLTNLIEVGCRTSGSRLTFHVDAGTTYHIQIGGLFGEGGPIGFHLEETPPLVAGFFFSPSNPSSLDTVQFCDQSSDPGDAGLQSFNWNFGDGATSTENCAFHQYAKDGNYTVQYSVTTTDGRSDSDSQVVQVRTHDVSISNISAPKSANVGQTKAITLSIRNTRYPETVRIELYRSVAGSGFELISSSTQFIPVRSGNRTTQFSFNYTFRPQDAQIGKVTFRAVVQIENANDAFPADNEAFSTPPTKVSR